MIISAVIGIAVSYGDFYLFHLLLFGLLVISFIQIKNANFLLSLKTRLGNYDLFLLRRLIIQMNSFISQFPDSPFALALSGVYFIMKNDLIEDDNNIKIAKENLFKSHKIIKDAID